MIGAEARSLRSAAVATIVVAAALVALGALVGARMQVAGVLGVSAGAVVSVHYGARRWAHPRLPAPPRPAEPVGGAPWEDFRRIRERVRWGEGSPEHFDSSVRPFVVGLADDRLRRLHGVDRALEPDRAARILGPELAAFVDSAAGDAPPTTAELARVVRQVRAL